MKVYIIIRLVNEPDPTSNWSILGVYSDEEKAEKFFKEQEAKYDGDEYSYIDWVEKKLQ